jgi:hypothetical protein
MKRELIDGWPEIMSAKTLCHEEEAQRIRERIYEVTGELDPNARALTMALIRVLNEIFLAQAELCTSSALGKITLVVADMVRLLDAPVLAKEQALAQLPVLTGWVDLN